jgi:hypothetical protein
VAITGDAGANELLRRFDAGQVCGPEKRGARVSCPAILAGILNAIEGGPLAGVAGAFFSSVACGKDLRALSDCREQAEALEVSAGEAVADCHARDGIVMPGSSSTEIICEVRP